MCDFPNSPHPKVFSGLAVRKALSPNRGAISGWRETRVFASIALSAGRPDHQTGYPSSVAQVSRILSLSWKNLPMPLLATGDLSFLKLTRHEQPKYARSHPFSIKETTATLFWLRSSKWLRLSDAS